MDQCKFWNLFVWLFLNLELKDKLTLFFKQVIIYERDSFKILIAILKWNELIVCQIFKFFFQLKSRWYLFIVRNKINNFLFGLIGRDLGQIWIFSYSLHLSEFLKEFTQLLFPFIKAVCFNEVVQEFILYRLIFCKIINYFTFKFLKITFIKT